MANRQSNSQMSQIFNYNSNGSQQQPGQVTSPTAYYSHAHASPYVNGKKNIGFAHPSFVSNQVFYTQDVKSNANNARQRGDYEEPRNNQREEHNEPAGNRYRDDREDNYGDNGRYQGKRQDYDNRDDRSEGSALSSANYICPNCLNRHLSEDQRNLCRKQREEDIERERRLTENHKRVAKEEEAQERFNRSRRLDEGHDLKDKLDREYNEKLEYRRSPKKDGSGSGFQRMFDRQENLVQRQKELNHAFGASLQDQMRHQSHQKYLEKERNSSAYTTSLQIGEGYHNRYLDGRSSNLGSELKEQVEDRAYQQRRERELEKRFAQERTEQEQREFEEDERRRKEREWNQKRNLKNDLLRTIEDHKSKQREELASKQSERETLDQGYSEYKRRQAEEEERAKRQLIEFGQGLRNQGNSSYKQQYEERRGQKEQTSFDPSSRSKKLYPCGDCHVPYEKAYLTKYD